MSILSGISTADSKKCHLHKFAFWSIPVFESLGVTVSGKIDSGSVARRTAHLLRITSDSFLPNEDAIRWRKGFQKLLTVVEESQTKKCLNKLLTKLPQQLIVARN